MMLARPYARFVSGPAMQLVSSEYGQSLQMLSMDEIRPDRGGFFVPDIAQAIVARYRFQSFPERIVVNQLVKFEQGTIELNGMNIPITGLDVYSDGFAIVARHTADADAVLDDFLQWGIRTFGLREPRTIIPRRYQSRLVVDMKDSSGNTFIKVFNKVTHVISSRFESEVPLGLTDLNIGPYPPTQYPFLHTWIFQPRIVQPIVPNRYFSAAPLSTDDHFAMLQDIEAVASG